jgi:hypothetical protein
VHRVIQAAMGWQNYRMHVFRGGEFSYGPDPEGMLALLEETKVRLAGVAEVGERTGCEYDFGDSWEHELRVRIRSLGLRPGPASARVSEMVCRLSISASRLMSAPTAAINSCGCTAASR